MEKEIYELLLLLLVLVMDYRHFFLTHVEEENLKVLVLINIIFFLYTGEVGLKEFPHLGKWWHMTRFCCKFFISRGPCTGRLPATGDAEHCSIL